jgi:hypothetical protein
MTEEEYRQEHDTLIEQLGRECGLLISSADSICFGDERVRVDSVNVVKIGRILDTISWLENRRLASIEPKPVKKFHVMAYKTRRYIMTIEAESQEQAIELGDRLSEVKWEGHECDSLPLEVRDAEEIDEEDQDD